MKKISIDELQHFAFNVQSDELMKELASDCFVVAANLALPAPNLTGRRYEAMAIWDTGATGFVA
ncbi:MAG: hypothetical protein OYH77_05440 [Pseudomonadota bacterium]|nr:hypothetical protein [Pseudomonadota bacterium]